MKKIKFNDKLGTRNRVCKYGVVYKNSFFSREEAEKANLAVFRAIRSEKNGKWSFTEWEVTFNSAKPVIIRAPFEGWPEKMSEAIKHIIEYNKPDIVLEEKEAEIALMNLFPEIFEKIKKKEEQIQKII